MRHLDASQGSMARRDILDGGLTSRLVLGTVQLGMPYGRRKTSPVMSPSEAFRILDAAWALGIRAFDTAEGYGSSPKRLRAWSESRGNAAELEVVTKCRVESFLSPREIEDAAAEALSRFDGVRRRVLLTHGAVAGANWPAVLSAAGWYDAVAGQSVYSPEEVSAACELPGIGRVQAPANVLDQRALRARGTGVLLDIRSIYLQGVLLDDPDAADARAPGVSPIVTALQAKASLFQTELAPLLVASMLRVIAEGDRLVLGVDDVSQLGAISAALEIADDTVRQFIDEVEPLSEELATAGILDPRTWPSAPPTARVAP